MSLFTKLGNDIAAPVDAAGNKRSVDNGDMQRWMTEVERLFASFQAGGGVIFPDLATANASLDYGPNQMAWVMGSDAPGIYRKVGASGSGSWARLGDLPYSFIRASNAGYGTANAIQADTNVPLPAGDGGALVSLNITTTNTASPVTVSFNGATPLTIKTSSGNNPVVGGLIAGMTVAGYKVGSTFRLLSDQASAAIVPAAEAAAAEAEGYRDEAAGYATLALSNWVVDTFTGDGTDAPLTLTASPGTVNNCIVTIEGEGPQPRHIFRLENGTDLYPPIGAVWPAGKQIEVAYGNAIEVEVGTPTDGSVTAPKIAAGAVTRTKVANDAINADKLASDPGELAAIAAKIGVQPAKLLNISLVRDTATYSTTATTLGAQGNVSRAFAASSPTSSLLVLVFFRLEMARDSTAGSTGMAVEPNHYTGTAYSASGELIEILDTDGPISQILRAGASCAIVLTAAQKRSDLPSGNGQWTVLNYFRSNNSQCTAKIIRQTFVFVEFEP